MLPVPLAAGHGGVSRGYKWLGQKACSNGPLLGKSYSQLSWRLCCGVQIGRVEAHCDKEALVEVINVGYGKDPGLMQLIRCLFFIRAAFDISIRAIHIPGCINIAADALSRNNCQVFHLQAPGAHPAPSFIPSALTGTSAAGLDIRRLVPVIQDLIAAGLAESTKKVYTTGEGRYTQFCDKFKLVPFPTSENTLLLFVGHLHQQSLELLGSSLF